MKNIKSKKGILMMAAILGLLALSYLGYQKYQENAKNADLANFAKIHNQKLEKANKAKAETSISKEKENKDEKTSETSTQNVKIAKKAKNNPEKEPPGVIEIKGEELKELLRYKKPLPPMPDEEENNSTLFGVDYNLNGVRDDLEIMIVNEYGDDEYMVELMFAGERIWNHHFYLSQVDELTESQLLEPGTNMAYFVGCAVNRYGYEYNRGFGSVLNKKRFNTNKRKESRIKVFAAGAIVSPSVNVNDQICRDFIERTKDEYIYNQ